jgi:hypothetical protein
MKNLFRLGRGLQVVFTIAASALVLKAANPPIVKTLGGGPNQLNRHRSGSANGDTLNVAKFRNPYAVAVDTNGNLLVADRSNGKIRRISKPGDADSLTSTFISGLRTPVGVAVDSSNYVYVVTFRDDRLRVFDGNGTLVRSVRGLRKPTALALDADGNVYVTQLNGNVQKVAPDDSVTLITAGFSSPRGIAVTPDGQLVVSETGNHAIYLVDPSSGASTLVAGANGRGFADGDGTIAKFNRPYGVAVGSSGIIAVADRSNHRVRLVTTNGMVSTLYGVRRSQWARQFAGWVDGPGGMDGIAAAHDPIGLTIASNGTLYVTEIFWDIVRQVTDTGLNSSNTTAIATNIFAPSINCSTDLFAVATGPSGAMVTYTVTSPETNVVVQCFPPSGSTFPMGTNLVTCYAHNTNNVTNSCSFTVTVGATQVLPVPLFTPSSGYYPFGVSVSVMSPHPVFYTTDGSVPTANSRQVAMSGGVGTIWFNESLRDLRSLRLRAISDTGASPVISGVSSSANEIGIPRDFVAGSGGTVVVPVVANLRTNDRVQSFQYLVQVTPLNGAPPVLPYFRPSSISTNDFIQLVTPAAKEKVAHYIYGSSMAADGITRRLAISASGTNANVDFTDFAATTMLVVPIDPAAIEGDTYVIQVLYPSGSSNGYTGEIPLTNGPARTITVRSTPWIVGDVAFNGGYNAGEFGNGILNNSDANAVLYASVGLRRPFEFSDVFNAMDTYPPEPAGQGGDGKVEFPDWQIVLNRSLGLDLDNWMRRWIDGGLIQSDPLSPSPSPAPAPAKAKGIATKAASGPGDVWTRGATLIAGNVYNVPTGPCRVPISVKVAAGTTLSGMAFRVLVEAENGAPAVPEVTFTPWVGDNAFQILAGAAPNDIVCAWSMIPSPAFTLQGSNIIGQLTFTIPGTANGSHRYRIHFLRPSGAADLQTDVSFDSVPGSAWPFYVPLTAAETTADEWRENFFGVTNNPAADQLADPDEDGVPNWKEYQEGTNPTDAGSYLHLDQTSDGGTITLSWLSAPAKLYTLQRRASPNDSWVSLATNVAGNGNTLQRSDSSPPPPPATPEYRIYVQP